MSLTIRVPFHNLVLRQSKVGSGWGPPVVRFNTSGTTPETFSDSRSPIVSGKKPKGWKPPTNYTRDIVYGQNRGPNVLASCVITQSTVRDTHAYAGAVDTSSHFTTLPSLPVGMQARCEVKCLQKLKKQSVNLSVALGERHQTARMVVQSLGRLAELVREVKAGNPKGLIRAAGRRVRRKKVRSLDPAFDLWLEYKYGWLPLLSDVHGAVKALHEREKEGNRVRVSVASGSTDHSVDTDNDVTFIAGSLSATADLTRRTEFKCFVRLDYVKNDTPWAPWTQLGITNPLTVGWELLPWSFVADWFVPIGAYLDILDADLGWSFLGGSASVKRKSVVTFTDAKYVPVAGLSDGYVTVYGQGKRMAFSRTKYSSSPIPSLGFLTTKFTTGSPEHVENAIALLMSAITHKYRA